MLPLSPVLLSALHDLSATGRRIVQVLAEAPGPTGHADFVAAAVGLRNRHQLARLLRREGLPQLEELAGWVCVLNWLIEWETRSTPLFKLAGSTHLPPPTCYRMVKRLTGVTWTRARARGFAWVLSQFLQECRTSLPERDLRKERASGETSG